MMNNKIINIARGHEEADLVLKNANIINVFTEQIEQGDIAISDGIIVGIGTYHGKNEMDCSGQYIAPGFLDGHIHIESSMLKPIEFAKAVLPHGTTGVITDPHEIANVCGTKGIEYMMEASSNLPIDVFFVLPSCVPSTSLDESGSVLLAHDLKPFYHHDKVVGLAEVMNYIGTIDGDEDILSKIQDAHTLNKIVDGHAPSLTDKELCAYVLAGVQSDHECSSIEEAKEKISRGQWVMVREGTAAKNLDALMELFTHPYCHRAMLVTDDKHPYDLTQYGHIDYIIRKAIKNGANPCLAIKMATYNTASYFGLNNYGAIAPGYHADLVILSDLNEVIVDKVLKHGSIVYEDMKTIPMIEIVSPKLKDYVSHSFHCSKLEAKDFLIEEDSLHSDINKSDLNKSDSTKQKYYRVIEVIKEQILTNELILPLKTLEPQVNIEEDIIKLAVIERHHNTGHIGLGLVHGFGLKKGAIASSVSHDSHNLIVIGTNDEDMAIAANCVREMEGGWAVVLDGVIQGQLALPIGGLMSELDTHTLSNQIEFMKEITRELGVVEGIDPFMTLGFISLPVIPELRLTTRGLMDVNNQTKVSLIIS